jgi:hypothetical protein
MKVVFLVWLQLGICAWVGWGQRSSPQSTCAVTISARSPSDRQTSSITFLTVPNAFAVHSLGSEQGVLNLGSISYFGRADEIGPDIHQQKDSFSVSTKFGLCLASSAHRPGTTTVRAFLQSSAPINQLWVDGVRLSTTPAVIGRQIPYDAITEHVLKVVIPVSMPAGHLLDSIGMTVTPN